MLTLKRRSKDFNKVLGGLKNQLKSNEEVIKQDKSMLNKSQSEVLEALRMTNADLSGKAYIQTDSSLTELTNNRNISPLKSKINQFQRSAKDRSNSRTIAQAKHLKLGSQKSDSFISAGVKKLATPTRGTILDEELHPNLKQLERKINEYDSVICNLSAQLSNK